MAKILKIQSIEHLTHDVLRIVTDKLEGRVFKPGQATEVAINQEGWTKKYRPFTFTSLPEEDHLEFVIKTYPDHPGVTNQLLTLQPGDELLNRAVFGDIHYKGEGVFLAGGAGITPFLAIIKQIQKEGKLGNNKLIFANKTAKDIILRAHLESLFGNHLVHVLSAEKQEGCEQGYITKELLQRVAGSTSQYFYLCGPKPMMEAVQKHLTALGVSEEWIVHEQF